MKKKLLALALSALVFFPLASQASVLSSILPASKQDVANLSSALTELGRVLEQLLAQFSPKLGASTQPIAGTNYVLSGSGVSAAASSITLTSLTIPQTGRLITISDLSTNFYVTLEPGSRTRQEIASCTGVTQNVAGTATLTGCSRGMLPVTPYTASSTYAFPHAGGTTLIFSNAPQLYQEFAATGNTTTITGAWTFASTSLPSVSSNTPTSSFSSYNLINKQYADGLAIAGAATISTSVAGIGKLATTSDLQNGVTTSGGYPLLVGAQSVSPTATASRVPVANGSGTIASGYIPQDASTTYSFLGGVTHASTTLNGTTTIPSITGRSLVGTNASSQLATVGSGATTGTLLQYYNNQWNAGLQPIIYNASTSLAASTSLQAVQTVTLPIAGPNTFYKLTFNETQSASAASTSIAINGTANQVVCALTGGATPFYQELDIQMLGSTSTQSQVVPFTAVGAGSVTCTNAGGANLTGGGISNIAFGTSPTIVFYNKVAGTDNINMTTTLMYYQ